MKEILVEAPGKIIISGEHSAVYGQPAMVACIDRTLFLLLKHKSDLEPSFFTELLEKVGEIGFEEVISEINRYLEESGELNLVSDIPIGSGMGSSAALGVALSTLLLELSGQEYDREDINRYAYKFEKMAHQNPSGIDNIAVVYGGINRFSRTDNGLEVETLKGRNFLDRMFVVNTGRPTETTATMVSGVKEKLDRNPEEMNNKIQEIGGITNSIEDLIVNNGEEKEFMELFKRNQELLEEIGIVSENCKTFIRSIEDLGGVAKVSGAGGSVDNSGMVLVYLPSGVKIDDLLIENGFETFPLKVSDGVRVSSKEVAEVDTVNEYQYLEKLY